MEDLGVGDIRCKGFGLSSLVLCGEMIDKQKDRSCFFWLAPLLVFTIIVLPTNCTGAIVVGIKPRYEIEAFTLWSGGNAVLLSSLSCLKRPLNPILMVQEKWILFTSFV